MKMYRRIRDLREDKDISQAEIAKAINISQRSYSYYETGKRMISPEILSAIALYHNVSVDYLLELTDNPTPKE